MKELDLDQAEHTHVSEAAMVLQYGLNSLSAFQNRAGWVSNTVEFRNWLGGPRKSQILCIQGHGGLHMTSPLSFLIALLHEKLEKAPRTLVLPFFCGRSTVSSGPAIMLRAFFVQLIALYDVHGNVEENERPLLPILGPEDIQNMQEVCYEPYAKAVTLLLRNLQKDYNAIFIMIDAVDFYDSEWHEEMAEFLRSMRKLAKEFNKLDNGLGVLRVMMTASSWSTCFLSSCRSVVVLDVPDHIDGHMDGFERFA
jgi:hypothetical protein